MVENTDRATSSWGGHINVMVTKQLHKQLVGHGRKLSALYALASFQASSVIITGAGKIGAENGEPAVGYQLSQRADWLECMTGIQTTINRPMVNSRDESLVGTYPASRLHIIFYDSNLCHVATFLKVGMLQIVLAMLEDDEFPRTLIYNDPLTATKIISRDPFAKEIEPELFIGGSMSAVDHQSEILDEAMKYCRQYDGDFNTIVPEYQKILKLWDDMLLLLDNEDLPALVGKLDWVTRKQIIDDYIEDEPETTFDYTSDKIQVLDLMYANLDPSIGLFWNCLDHGLITEMVSHDDIEDFVHNPPTETRAWTRGQMVQLSQEPNPEVTVKSVDWDRMSVEVDVKGSLTRRFILDLSNPLSFTQEITDPAFLKYEQKGKPKKLLKALKEIGENS